MHLLIMPPICVKVSHMPKPTWGDSLHVLMGEGAESHHSGAPYRQGKTL